MDVPKAIADQLPQRDADGTFDLEAAIDHLRDMVLRFGAEPALRVAELRYGPAATDRLVRLLVARERITTDRVLGTEPQVVATLSACRRGLSAIGYALPSAA